MSYRRLKNRRKTVTKPVVAELQEDYISNFDFNQNCKEIRQK